MNHTLGGKKTFIEAKPRFIHTFEKNTLEMLLHFGSKKFFSENFALIDRSSVVRNVKSIFIHYFVVVF